MMKSIDELIAAALAVSESAAGGSCRIAVAAAHDEEVLKAVEEARQAGLASALLIGDKNALKRVAAVIGVDLSHYQIIDERDTAKAAAAAVAAVRRGDAACLMKGLLDTSIILKAALNKENGLRAGRLISHISVIESEYYHKLLLITDAAINIAPLLEEKIDIIRNAVDCAHALGIERPKVALLCAVEKLNPEKMPCTAEAAILTQMNRRNQITDCVIDGPLALDNAVSAEAARIKKIDSPVAGEADILVTPDIEAGNILYKALVDLCGARAAGLVMGAASPIILTSRSDTAETKLASIALAVLAVKRRK